MSFSKPIPNRFRDGASLGFAMPPSPPNEMANNYDAVKLNQYLPEIRAMQQAQSTRFSRPASRLDATPSRFQKLFTPSGRAQNDNGAFNPYAEQYSKYSSPSQQASGVQTGQAVGDPLEPYRNYLMSSGTTSQAAADVQQIRKFSTPFEEVVGLRSGQGISPPHQTFDYSPPSDQSRSVQNGAGLLDSLPEYLRDVVRPQKGNQVHSKPPDSIQISPPFADADLHYKMPAHTDENEIAQHFAQMGLNSQTPGSEYDRIQRGLKARLNHLTQTFDDEVASAKYSTPSPWNTAQRQPTTMHNLRPLERVYPTPIGQRSQAPQAPRALRVQQLQQAPQSQQSQHFQAAQGNPYTQDLTYARDNTFARNPTPPRDTTLARDSSYAHDESYTTSFQNGQQFNHTVSKPVERASRFDAAPMVPPSVQTSQNMVPYNPNQHEAQYGGGHTSSRVWVSDRARQEEQYEVAQIGVRRNFRRYDKDIMQPIKDFGSWLEHQSAMNNVKLEAEKRKIADMEQRAAVREKQVKSQHGDPAILPFFANKHPKPGHGAVLDMPTIWCRDWKTVDRRVAPWPTLSEMKWEGDDRARTGVKRFLPLPREPTNGAVPWNHLPVVHQQPLDQVWKIPTELDIIYPMHQISEEAERDQHMLLPSDLLDVLQPGPRDVFGKNDLDPSAEAAT